MDERTRQGKESLIGAMIAFVLGRGSVKEPLGLNLSKQPTGWPTPKRNHFSGMRRKAQRQGRKYFKAYGKTRRA